MTGSSTEAGSVWPVVLERFERHAPASMMARTALKSAFAAWVDEVFEAKCQRQYSRELLVSTVVELMTLVSLGLRPLLHAPARQTGHLPGSLASLYGKANPTEAGLLGALVQSSAQRLAPIIARMAIRPALRSYAARVLDGHHLPRSEKRLAMLRGHRGAALPGQSIMVYVGQRFCNRPDRGRGCPKVNACWPFLRCREPSRGRFGLQSPFLHPDTAGGLGRGGGSLHCARAHPSSAPGKPED